MAELKARLAGPGRPWIMEVGLVVGIVAITIGAHVTRIGEHADLTGYDYDEGVYWQSLRAMGAGYRLYEDIFSAQPPLFLLSIYPFYQHLGQTIAAAREGVALLSSLGLVGAYLMGRALSGTIGGLTALTVLAVMPPYFWQSEVLQAEAPACAFLFLTIGFILFWDKRSTGLSGGIFAALCATAVSIGILVKLFNVTAIVPISLALFERARIARPKGGLVDALSHSSTIYAGVAVAAFWALSVIGAFSGSLAALFQQTVTFHLAVEHAGFVSQNLHELGRFFARNSLLSVGATIGATVAILGRDWRVVPLAAWLLCTFAFLAVHSPMFPRHEIVLLPPLIGVMVLGFAGLPTTTVWKSARRYTSAILVTLAVVIVGAGIHDDFDPYQGLVPGADAPEATLAAEIVADLKRNAADGGWIVSDAPFITALANLDTPPWLADTSFVRISAGYLTEDELIRAASDPRVHAVLFVTGRLKAAPIARFHDWVAANFKLFRRYRDDVDLWSR